MVNPLTIAVPLTILPAMGMLWFMLYRYEGYFEDARVFFSLTVGFFAGLVASAFETQMFPFHNPIFVDAMGVTTAFLFFVFGYAIWEAAAQTMVLGLKRFRERLDTPYYGMALGLGFGAMVSLLFLGILLQNLETLFPNLRGFDYWRSVAILSIVPVSGIFIHGAAGTVIGLGTSRGTLWQGMFRGTMIIAPLYLFQWMLFYAGGEQALVHLGNVGAAAYAGLVLWFAQTKILDTIVPKEIRDRVRREKRKEMQE